MNSIRNFFICMMFFISGCTTQTYIKTVDHVDLNKFLKKWYVIAGRFTFLEEGAHNAVEHYSFNKSKKRIDIDFYFNKDSFNGPLKKIPQTAWIENPHTNAHWMVSPFWPIKFDYLVIALDPNYTWTAIGVPNGKYLWIMSEKPDLSEDEISSIIQKVQLTGYPVKDIVRLPQKWP